MTVKFDKTTLTDTCDNIVKDEKGNYMCGCGNSKLQMTMHIDGADFYFYNYKCVSCGNVFEAKTERDEDDILRWDGEE